MPAAAPSILSRKLKALIIRTIQKAERAEVIILFSMKNSTRTSAKAAAVIATANWTASLKRGPRCFLSSHRPSRKRTNAQSSMITS
jgi:hypothetical protein